MTRETRAGWVGSFLLHALLLVLLLVLTVPNATQREDFIEVQWGSVASAAPASRGEAGREETPVSISPPTRSTTRITVQASQPVVLPRRTLPDPSQENLPMPRVDKLGPPGGTAAVPEKRPALEMGEREVAPIRRDGEGGPGQAARGVLPSGSPGAGASSSGGGVGAGAPYTIDWVQGGTRKLLSGELPAYPPGVSVEAQVKLLTTVEPDGSVSFVQPVQKANRQLEEAAIKQVRLWKFDPLRSGQPQVSQNCVITFLFKLR